MCFFPSNSISKYSSNNYCMIFSPNWIRHSPSAVVWKSEYKPRIFKSHFSSQKYFLRNNNRNMNFFIVIFCVIAGTYGEGQSSSARNYSCPGVPPMPNMEVPMVCVKNLILNLFKRLLLKFFGKIIIWRAIQLDIFTK